MAIEKTKVTTPWKPASLLTLGRKEPGFRNRWCRKELIEKKLLEGWEVVRTSAKDATPEITLMDGTKLTGIIQKRNLILCRMPEELAIAREEYHTNLSDSAAEAPLREFENVAGKGNFYGKKEVTHG